jgi:hypothetical protein
VEFERLRSFVTDFFLVWAFGSFNGQSIAERAMLQLCILKRALLSVRKGKCHIITGHEVPYGEYRYNSTLSLASALHMGGWSMSRPGRFTPEKPTRYPLYRRRGGPKAMSRWVRKISPPTGFDPRTDQLVARRNTD